MRMKNLLPKQVYLSHNAFMASGMLMLSLFFCTENDDAE